MCDCSNTTNKITIDVHAYNTIYEKAVYLDVLYNFIKTSRLESILKDNICRLMNWEELVKTESEDK